MKALILQHSKSTPVGSTLDWLVQNKIEFTVLAAPKLLDENFAETLYSYDILFICGGFMNVDQETTYPWLINEKLLIRNFIAQNKIIVGLCLGGQLLAEALGGSVQKHREWEIGWHEVSLLSPHSPKKLMAFEWHGYSFTLPPTLTESKPVRLLATNECCSAQAFLYGSRVLGVQFHPEASLEWILNCADDPSKFPEKSRFVQTPEQIREGIKYQPALRDWYFRQLDALQLTQ